MRKSQVELAVYQLVAGDAEAGANVAVDVWPERTDHRDRLILVDSVPRRVPEAHVLRSRTVA